MASKNLQSITKLEAILKCPVCKKIVEKPKILNCCHTLCKSCIDKQEKVNLDEQMGIYCPVCHVFTNYNSIDSSFFLNELLDMYADLKDDQVYCAQCLSTEGTWKCFDCKISLCSQCKMGHWRIPLLRHHNIVEREKVCELFVDRIVFCGYHIEEPIKFSCADCDTPICIKCKVTRHDNHKTETIEENLKRMLTDINTEKNDITKKIASIDQNIQEFTEFKESLKKSVLQAKGEAKNRLNDVIRKAEAEHDELVKQLDAKEKQGMTDLNEVLKERQNKRAEYEQVLSWVSLCVDTAKGVTLMTEIHDSLLHKLRIVRKEFCPGCFIRVDFPWIESIPKMDKKLLGKVKDSGKFLFRVRMTSCVNRGVILPDNFSSLDVSNSNQLSSRCTRIGLVNNDIWCPFPDNHQIEIFSTSGETNGKIDMTNNIECPRSVQQAATGDILLASDSGIHKLNDDGSISNEVTQGKFSDISIDSDMFVALQYDTSEVWVFYFDGNKWKNAFKFHTDVQFIEPDHTIRCDIENQCVFIAGSDCVKKYRLTGDEMANFDGFSWPFLCYRDEKGVILVADSGNKQFKCITEDTCKMVSEVPYSPYCCVYDSHHQIWVVNNYEGNSLTKYKI